MNSLISGQEHLLQLEFNSKSLGEFWYSLREAYHHLLKQAMQALIPFATTYLIANQDFQHFQPSE
jgi:hypothetical protein